jgi:hypothetical protein
MRRASLTLTALILAVMMLLSTFGVGLADWDNFSDVQGHWAQEALERAYELGFLQGYDESTMAPNAPITTAQIATLLCRIIGATEKAQNTSFNMSPHAWYYDAILKAEYLGLFDGNPSDPDAPMRRADAIGAVVRCFGLEQAQPDYSVLSPFGDAALMTSAERDIIAAAISAGLIQGKGSVIDIDAPITRAELITIIFRLATYFSAEAHKVDRSIDGGIIANGNAELSDYIFYSGIWFGCRSSEIHLSNVTADFIIFRSHDLGNLRLDNGTYINRLVLGNQGGDVVIDGSQCTIGSLVINPGGGSVTADSVARVEINSSGREINLKGEVSAVIISGDGNTINIDRASNLWHIKVTGKNNVVNLEGQLGNLQLGGRNNTVTGGGKISLTEIFGSDCVSEVRSDSILDDPLSGLSLSGITLSAQRVLPAGEALYATANIRGLPDDIECLGTWYINGKKIKEVIILGDMRTELVHSFEYSRNMDTNAELTFVLGHVDKFGVYDSIRAKHTTQLENYDPSHYWQNNIGEVMAMVTLGYFGDYTTAWAEANDHDPYLKEVWVNARGYSSDTEYLLWVNLAYQRINIFTGWQGNWTLLRSGIIATGKTGSATPVGIWKTTYKQVNGWTTATYTVKPVVRFRGGGYAFHSRLYYPNTSTLQDPSIGFPVSAGCVRMMDEDIQFLYDYVPDGTTVVVY